MFQRKFIPLALAMAFAFGAVGSTFAATHIETDVSNQVTTQLPRTVKPAHYMVSVEPDMQASTFTGTVSIAIQVLESTKSITLNAADLAFQSAEIKSAQDLTAKSVTQKAAHIKVDNEKQTATIQFDHAVPKGNHVLTIAYSGVIGSQANGLFKVDYDTAAGHQRAIFTQFENSDARRFFPCWDEPNYKATIDLTAIVPSELMAVSNMPIKASTPLGNGKSEVRFKVTPRMSTYLLFFSVGDFERATDAVDGIEVGTVSQKGALPQASFALQSSKHILSEYNDYFGIRYPLPKLDNIAAPGSSQFFSAMENWGAIFTFEYAMLLDPNISTLSDKERVFETEAHEMAHQWFGDLVTMQWWDDLWLNEGFASWMENRTTAKLHPEWGTRLDAVETHENAMSQDSMSTTHPIVQHIATVEQASQAFDAITYQKGESVIRMLEDYVGADNWRNGVRLYMKEHAYGNTKSDDFWRAIESASGKPITSIAHDFTLQPGIPMINVKQANCNDGQTTLELTQSEFSRDHMDKKSLSWHVPVTAKIIGSEPSRLLVSDGKASAQLAGCGTLVVNAGQAGYFRTRYSEAQFKSLTDQFSALDPIDQLGLLSDAFALGMNGMQPISDVLNLAVSVPGSAEPQVWNNVANLYARISYLYRDDEQRQQQFNQFATKQLSPIMAKVGWSAKSDDTAATINLRELLIQTLSGLNDPATIAEAKRRYDARETDPSAFPVELRRVIIDVLAYHADQATWDKLHEMAKSEKSPMIKDQLYHLLSSSKDRALAQQALDLALTDEPGATNSAGMLDAVAGNYPDLAFDFAIKHLKQVEALVDGTSRSRYLPQIASGSSDKKMIDKLNAYAKAHISKSAMASVKSAEASIRYHIKAKNDRLPEINLWLAQHQ